MYSLVLWRSGTLNNELFYERKILLWYCNIISLIYSAFISYSEDEPIIIAFCFNIVILVFFLDTFSNPNSSFPDLIAWESLLLQVRLYTFYVFIMNSGPHIWRFDIKLVFKREKKWMQCRFQNGKKFKLSVIIVSN